MEMSHVLFRDKIWPLLYLWPKFYEQNYTVGAEGNSITLYLIMSSISLKYCCSYANIVDE